MSSQAVRLVPVIQALKAAGIEMSVDSCSCCGGAHVDFVHKGKVLLECEDMCSFDTRKHKLLDRHIQGDAMRTAVFLRQYADHLRTGSSKHPSVNSANAIEGYCLDAARMIEGTDAAARDSRVQELEVVLGAILTRWFDHGKDDPHVQEFMVKASDVLRYSPNRHRRPWEKRAE